VLGEATCDVEVHDAENDQLSLKKNAWRPPGLHRSYADRTAVNTDLPSYKRTMTTLRHYAHMALHESEISPLCAQWCRLTSTPTSRSIIR
jgi:uncharacterized Zn-finger protein